jgi:hypothetical protein
MRLSACARFDQSRIAVAAAIGSASTRATQLIKRNHLTLAAAMVVVTEPSADRAVTATTAKRIFRCAEAFAKPQRRPQVPSKQPIREQKEQDL